MNVIAALFSVLSLVALGVLTVLHVTERRDYRRHLAEKNDEVGRLKRSVAALVAPAPVTEPAQVARETEQRFELAGRIVSPTYGPNFHKSFRARVVDNRKAVFEWVNERLGTITDRDRERLEAEVTYRVEIDWRWAPDSIVSWQRDDALTEHVNGRRLTKDGGQPGWFDTRREAEQAAHAMLDQLDQVAAGRVVQ